MKPSQALYLSAKVLFSLTLLFVCPLFLPAQSKDKKSNPPPPPPRQQPQKPQRQQQQPPTQQRPVQQPQQQRPANTQQNGGDTLRGAAPVGANSSAPRWAARAQH